MPILRCDMRRVRPRPRRACDRTEYGMVQRRSGWERPLHWCRQETSMANPSIIAEHDHLTFEARDTQYLAVCLQLRMTAGGTARFSLELPMAIASIGIAGATSRAVSTAATSSFSDMDPS